MSTGNPTDTDHVARSVAEATAALALANMALANRDDAWRHSIREALAAGMSAPTVARLAGVSTSRVYQIRDGRRTDPAPTTEGTP